jgi:hypothetical protein
MSNYEDTYAVVNQDDKQKEKDKTENTNSKLKTFVVIIIIASLVWGFVGSVELLILSTLQTILPTKSNFLYAVLQIIIYLFLLAIVIYLTQFDASTLFINGSANHFSLQNQLS